MDRGFHLGLFDSIITNSFADMLFTPPSPGIGRASASRVVPGLFLPDLSFRLKRGRANCRRPTICAVSPELRSCARGLELDKAVLQLIPDRRYQIHDARPIRRAAIGRSAGPLSSAARSPAAAGVRLDTQHVGGPVDPLSTAGPVGFVRGEYCKAGTAAAGVTTAGRLPGSAPLRFRD